MLLLRSSTLYAVTACCSWWFVYGTVQPACIIRSKVTGAVHVLECVAYCLYHHAPQSCQLHTAMRCGLRWIVQSLPFDRHRARQFARSVYVCRWCPFRALHRSFRRCFYAERCAVVPKLYVVASALSVVVLRLLSVWMWFSEWDSVVQHHCKFTESFLSTLKRSSLGI